MNKNQKQQGDVTLNKIKSLPNGARRVIPRGQRGIILAEGEHTGHAHVIEDTDAELIEIGGRMILVLEQSATLRHEEHKSIVLEPGVWEVGQVNTIDHLTGMVSKVQD